MSAYLTMFLSQSSPSSDIGAAGPRIPSEELIGQLPPGLVARKARAYLSNVCTAAAARRLGVAAGLVHFAADQAAKLGILRSSQSTLHCRRICYSATSTTRWAVP